MQKKGIFKLFYKRKERQITEERTEIRDEEERGIENGNDISRS